jgi:hypothetical protein
MKLDKWRLIWLILFNPRNAKYGNNHNTWLMHVINYALTHHSEKRGAGASDVLIYDLSNYKIFKL